MYKYVKLRNIANIMTGFPFKGKLYSSKGVKVLRGENVTVGSLRWDSIKCWEQEFDQFEKYSLKKCDIVIGMDGSRVGKNRARIKENDLPLLLAQRVARLRSNELSNQDFLYYLIRDDRFEEYVNRIQTGSSIPHISQNQIGDFTVPLPPLVIQAKIAEILLCLDSKIEFNNRINAELESMAKMLYDYWFVQFDFPNEDGKPYKSSGGEMVWNEKLKRKITAGWQIGQLGKMLKTNLGGTPSTKKPEYWKNATIPWLNSGDIAEFPVTNSSSFTTQKGVENSATTVLPKGSVVISLVRYIRPSIIAIEACAN
jgi:type I restriction enzyme, S subunit